MSISLQHFLYFSSEFFYFPSPFFKFLFRVPFLLPFTIYSTSYQSFLLFLSTIFYTPLQHFFTMSLFTSLQGIHNSFYLTSMFFIILQGFVIFLLSFSIFLLPFSFFKLFLLSFGIFVVSFLIFKYRRKLNCNNFLLDKKFLKRITKASLGHV